MFEIIIKPKAQKALGRIHPKDKDRIILALEEFKHNPFNSKFDILKLKGSHKLEKAFRLRIGEMRIIFELYQKERLILILFIDYRRTTTYS